MKQRSICIIAYRGPLSSELQWFAGSMVGAPPAPYFPISSFSVNSSIYRNGIQIQPGGKSG